MSVKQRFQELVEGRTLVDELASLQDLLDLSAIIDDELAKVQPLAKSVKANDSELVKQWGHTEGRD